MASSTSSTISSNEMQQIVDKLKFQRCRDSTRSTYYRIWKLFSQFFLRLDQKPVTWEQRLILFTGYLINNNLKSSTIKTYLSGIWSILADENIPLDSQDFTLKALTRACKIHNDKMIIRLPIHKDLLNLLVTEISRWSREIGQIYLGVLYSALFLTDYYGLLRVGELRNSPHSI